MHTPTHHLLALLALLALATTASSTCLTDSNAQRIADNFSHLFSDFSEEFANSTLTEDITDQTDSVGWLISNGTDCPHPLGSVTLSSRREFLDAQATQPNLPVSCFFFLFFEGGEGKRKKRYVEGFGCVERERERDREICILTLFFHQK